MVYRAIGFDWNGVINGKPSRFFRQRISEILEVTEEQYREAYFHHSSEFNRGKITTEELWVRVLEELGKQDKLEETLNLVTELGQDDLNIEVLELVGNLKNSGYRVGLLSNNTKEKGKAMRASGVDKHFDVFHISAETGLVKPSTEAYLHFIETLGVQPEELIFIDDTPKSLSVSSQLGFTPILFDHYSQLADELHQLGVTF